VRIVLALVLAAFAKGPPPPPKAAPEAPPVQAAPSPPGRPENKPAAITDTLHGVAVEDPYRWLEDEKAPEVQAWMDAQDAHARAFIAGLPGRDTLAARLKELYYVDSTSVPIQRGARLFYSKTLKEKEKAIYYLRDGLRGAERVVLDPNTWSEGGNPVSLGSTWPSWDGKRLAYTTHPNHADEAVLHVMDLDTGKESDVIEGAKYASVSWTPDGTGIYYEWLPTDTSIPVDKRPGFTEIRYHVLGTDPSRDLVIQGKTGDPETFLDGDLSRDGNYLFSIVQHGWNATDVRFRDLRKDKEFKPLVVGQEALYFPMAWKDRFYVLTDEGAPKKRIFVVDPKKPERKAWKELVPEDKDATLDGFSIVGGKLAMTYTKNAFSEVRLATLDGKGVTVLPLPGVGVTGGLVGDEESPLAFYGYSSYTTPPEVHQFELATGQDERWSKVELPIEPGNYTVEQKWFPSKDGTKVPMFIVHRKDVKLDGQNPTLLYGYGGFDVSLLPEFRTRLYPWLEAGGIYVVANLRGGGEFGKDWHDAGRLHKKQNVFDDFAGAAEFLIREKYTSNEKLAIFGGSNGGLLMGAAMTQRPDLFRAVACAVPLLDMIRYQLFGSGRTWIPEYGNAENKEDFPSIFAYSPYHHVARAAYPSLLMLSADHDDRVDPMHARKFVAAVQDRTTSGRPAILRIEKNAGHGGADQVAKTVEYTADMYSFLLNELGVAR
jgi:prolyl oligopeptidase